MDKMQTGLSAPWVTYYRKLEALFGQDPDVALSFDEDAMQIKLFVQGQEKARAIDYLLPDSVTYGNVEIEVIVVPANADAEDEIDMIKKAFEGNPVFAGIIAPDASIWEPAITYVMFAHEIVQFFNDNLGDPRGYETTLYEVIADEVLEVNGVAFCTE